MDVPNWLEESTQGRPEVELDGRAEVAIVGAGVTGCSAALRLAEAGLRVRVHDARGIAEGAAGDAPLGRHLRPDAGHAAARRPGAGSRLTRLGRGGYSGHGNVLGFACGELVADAMLGREAPQLELLDPARFFG